MGRTARSKTKNTTTTAATCPSCDTPLIRVSAVEGVGRFPYVDSEGEERVALLIDEVDIVPGCLDCGEDLPPSGLPGPFGGRYRIVLPDEGFDSVDLFDNRELLSSHLSDQTDEEFDLDYEMVMVDATLGVVLADGYVNLLCDALTIDEASSES
jgi:hypothetical protein